MAKRSKKKTRSPEVGQTTRVEVKEILPIQTSAANGKLILLQAALIVAAGFWVFWPALHGTWIGDDRIYFADNSLLQDPARLWKAWFEPGSFIEYYPIEETVQWRQWHLWGNETLGYHLTNLVLHLTGAFLVWKLFSKFGLRWAWLGGLIFAVHPMQVESVALINELKNVLSLPPLLMAMCAYIDYDEGKEKRDYWIAFGWFVTAMLCKISGAAFPLVILLYAWWKQGHIRWIDLKASAPFLVVTLLLGAITVWAGAKDEIANSYQHVDIPLGDFWSRLALAGLSLSFYFARCFLPLVPLPIYPQWPVNPPSLVEFLPWLIWAVVLAVIWRKRHLWGKHVTLGLGFFVLNLLPFLGFNTVSYMVSTWVMDHFLYLPIIGLIGLVVAGLGHIDGIVSVQSRIFIRASMTIAVALLAWESHGYADKFSSEDELCAYTIEHNPAAWLARYNLGYSLMHQGRLSQALDQFEAANRLYPSQ